jgi:hypothetical protein
MGGFVCCSMAIVIVGATTAFFFPAYGAPLAVGGVVVGLLAFISRQEVHILSKLIQVCAAQPRRHWDRDREGGGKAGCCLVAFLSQPPAHPTPFPLRSEVARCAAHPLPSIGV